MDILQLLHTEGSWPAGPLGRIKELPYVCYEEMAILVGEFGKEL